MAALSQLSYSPFECVFISKGNTRALAIARRDESEVLLVLAGHDGDREQKAPVELAAVDPEEVNVVAAVGTAHQPHG